MSLRFIPLVVSAVIALGCANNPPATGAGGGTSSNSGHVVIDGAFGDWSAASYVARREASSGQAGAPGFASNADVIGVAQRADAHYVYLRLDLAGLRVPRRQLKRGRG